MPSTRSCSQVYADAQIVPHGSLAGINTGTKPFLFRESCSCLVGYGVPGCHITVFIGTDSSIKVEPCGQVPTTDIFVSFLPGGGTDDFAKVQAERLDIERAEAALKAKKKQKRAAVQRKADENATEKRG